LTNKEPIKIGIIGCGIAAKKYHWPVIKQLRRKIEITAVCNHTAKKAKEFAALIKKTYGQEIPYGLDYQDLLKMPQIDAVTIILPTELNLFVCKEAAKAGKHIMVEKPLAENLTSASKLLEVEKDHPKLVMMVAENFRYRSVYDALAKALKNGEIGRPYYVEWKCWQQIDPKTNAYARTHWRIEHKYEGGFVTDAGVHHVAALREIFGDLRWLGSTKASINPAIGRTDTLVFLFNTSGTKEIAPVSGILNWGFSVNGKKEFIIQVLGSKGMAIVADDSLTIFGKNEDDLKFSQSYPDDGGYLKEYEDFIDCIKHHKKPRSTFQQAYQDLETILTALKRAAA
jgi:predicted dehydrogenase